MKLFGYTIKRETRAAEVPVGDLKDPSPELLELFKIAQNATGITVTPLRALGVASVFACWRVLADAVATLPLDLMQVQGRNRGQAKGHRLYSVLHDMPNLEMTSTDFRTAMQLNLTSRSNGYAEILRDVDGDAVGLYPMEYKDVEVYRDPNKVLQYRHIPTGIKLRQEDVLHVRGLSFNGILGLDTMKAVQECIALAIALQDNAAKFFGNGSRPGGVLEHPASLSTDAQERLRNQVESQMGGKNLYRLLVLEEGLKYSAQRTDNKDSQFDESRQAQDLNICRVYGVPPHKIGILSGQPRANVEQDNIGFIMDTVRPICVRWEQTLNARLLTEEERDQGFYIKFNLNALLRGDMQSRYAAMAIGRQWGWLSANDCREMEDMSAIEGGDTYLQPLNMASPTDARTILLSGKASLPVKE